MKQLIYARGGIYAGGAGNTREFHSDARNCLADIVGNHFTAGKNYYYYDESRPDTIMETALALNDDDRPAMEIIISPGAQPILRLYCEDDLPAAEKIKSKLDRNMNADWFLYKAYEEDKGI